MRDRFFSVRPEADFTTVMLSRDLSDSVLAEGLMHQLRELIDALGPVKVVIDFSGLDACPSAVMAALIAAQRQLNTLGGQMNLSVPSARIRAVFERLNLNLLFHIYPDRDEAIRACREGSKSD